MLRFQESGFCAPWYRGALKLSWRTLGILVQKLVFLCFSSTQALMLCLKHGKAFMLQRGGAVPVRSEPRLRALCAQTGPALLAVSERRWILQHIQATYSSPGSFGTREIV